MFSSDRWDNSQFLWTERNDWGKMASKRNNRTKITVRDVSKLPGVSMATVSRVLNRPEIVSPDKVKKVRKAMKLLDYRPNFFARGIKTRTSQAIAFVYPTDREHIVLNPLYSKIFEGVKIDFRQMGALGMRRILGIIKQKEQRDRICIMSVPAKLIIRDSIGPCKKKG